MNLVEENIKKSFVDELRSEGNLWQLMKKDTFIDLINTHFKSHQEYTDKDLIAIINLAIKFKLNRELGTISLPPDANQASKLFNKDLVSLEKRYIELLNDAAINLQPYTGKTSYDLHNELIHLRVISQLDLRDLSDDLLDHVIGISLHILNKD